VSSILTDRTSISYYINDVTLPRKRARGRTDRHSHPLTQLRDNLFRRKSLTSHTILQSFPPKRALFRIGPIVSRQTTSRIYDRVGHPVGAFARAIAACEGR